MTQIHADSYPLRMPEQPAIALISQLRTALRAAADPDRAPQMQAYMKSAMPYLGVRVPQVRAITRAVAREHPVGSADALQTIVATVWDQAEYREERYAATALLDAPGVRPLRTPDLITLVERLIVSGAWWDHVDELSHRVGELLLAFPTAIRPVVWAWRVTDDRWLRRAAIICQLGARERTDRDLLAAAIEANAADPDFFLRKAIGWALRDYARTAPEWVRGFVASHQLSALSVREATKHL